MMDVPLQHTAFSISCGSLILVTVVEMIRRNHLQERYAALWILIGLAFVSYSWWLTPLAILASWLQVGDVVTAVLFLGILMCSLLIMQLSMKVSEFSVKIKNLVQQVSLLQHELRERERRENQTI